MSIYWAMAGHSVLGYAAAADAASAKREARGAKSDVREVEAKLDRALIACEAMWTLLRDKLGITDEQLNERIKEIDLSDGRLDGKARRPAVPCANCGRAVSQRFAQCIYCGHAVGGPRFA